jgi:CheY-like chemotaxis protein
MSNVLLLEDNPGFHKLAMWQLKSVGHKVIQAWTVFDAIQALEHHEDGPESRIDISVFDANIPLDENMDVGDINGTSVKRVIRTMELLGLLGKMDVIGLSADPFREIGLYEQIFAPAQFIDLGKNQLHKLGETTLQLEQRQRQTTT